MSHENNPKAYILQAIDQLRKRKARPDFEHISHIVSRRQGLTVGDIEAELTQLVEDGAVAKVDYKGNTSYRNMAKWSKRGIGKRRSGIPSSNTRILGAIRALLAEKHGRKTEAGEMQAGASVETGLTDTAGSDDFVSVSELEEFIARSEATASLSLSGAALRDALNKLVTVDKALRRVSDVEFALAEGYNGMTSSAAADAGKMRPVSASSPSVGGSSGDESPTSPPNSVTRSTSVTTVTKLPARRGRPPGSGRGRKRSVPSDSVVARRLSVKTSRRDSDIGGAGDSVDAGGASGGEDGEVSNDSNTTIPDPRCDFCQLTAAENKTGRPEPLLFCKDCLAKAHPSCMDYSDQLARRARRSPWQCMDCKTCSLCSDAGDPDTLLFCDACDKGYHMTCHQPPVCDKPQGKWVCQRCEDEVTGVTAETGAFPTPRQSPVPFQEELRKMSDRRSVKSSSSSSPPLSASRLPASPPVPDASAWTVADVVHYFSSIGFENDAHVFQDQDIDGKSVLLMRRQDVVEGLSLKLGIALKMYARIQRLQGRTSV